MTKIIILITTVFVILSTALNSNAQNTYFYNQKNFFSLKASFNPRLIPMRQDKVFGKDTYGNVGVGRGTYYIYYDDNNQLAVDQQKVNLMLNANYGRLFDGNRFIGAEFNYQKHHFTVNENANIGYEDGWYEDYDSHWIPYEISTPVFNIYDIQFQYGKFSSNYIAPNKHLWTYGIGVRIISLDQKQNYRSDSETPFTDLNDFMEDYDKPFIFFRASINYTYRILITKNLSLDLGFNLNAGAAMKDAAAMAGIPSQSDYITNNQSAYPRFFMKSNLSNETFHNIFYFRSGLSYAF